MQRLLIVVALMALAGCSGSSDATTTTARSVTSTQATSSTTTITSSPPATSSTTSTTIGSGEIDYPENPGTVDDIPDALTAYIGAPMPDPDLGIAGPDDLDSWMTGWLDWLAWVHANPAEAADQLGTNMIPGSEQFSELRAALAERAEAGQRLLGGGFIPVSTSGTFDELFEDKTALRIVMVTQGPPSYLVDENGRVVSVFEGLDGGVTVSALLRFDPEREEWLMETFEVLGRS